MKQKKYEIVVIGILSVLLILVSMITIQQVVKKRTLQVDKNSINEENQPLSTEPNKTLLDTFRLCQYVKNDKTSYSYIKLEDVPLEFGNNSFNSINGIDKALYCSSDNKVIFGEYGGPKKDFALYTVGSTEPYKELIHYYIGEYGWKAYEKDNISIYIYVPVIKSNDSQTYFNTFYIHLIKRVEGQNNLFISITYPEKMIGDFGNSTLQIQNSKWKKVKNDGEYAYISTDSINGTEKYIAENIDFSEYLEFIKEIKLKTQ